MNIQYFLLFFGLMFPLVFSPGPANIVFAMSGIRQGVRGSIPLIIGVDLVFIIYSLLIGFGLGEILQLYPSLIFILQLLGSLYIVYLAYKFIRSDKKETDSNNQTFTFKDGVILQMLNPKGWTMLFLMFSTLLDGSFNYNAQIVALVIMLAILNISTHFITHKGLPCGNEGFIRKLSDKVGRDLSFKKRVDLKKGSVPFALTGLFSTQAKP
jgi:threonine/homoserine/homoserine lactone efflux protein